MHKSIAGLGCDIWAIQTMETSAKSETCTDSSWQWASNGPLNSWFIFSMSLLTMLAYLVIDELPHCQHNVHMLLPMQHQHMAIAL